MRPPWVLINGRIQISIGNMSGAADIGKCNSYAMEKMKAIDEQERLEKMHTKQKAGTPTVSLIFRIKA